MNTRRCIQIIMLVLLAVTMWPETASAQFIKKLKDRAKQNAGDRVIEKVIEKENEAIDKAMGEAGTTAPAQTSTATGSPDAGPAEPAAAATPEAIAQLKPGEGAWANYDFVPGERPLFVDDFSKDKVGDFPRRLEFIGGSMEIVEWQGARWIRDGGEGEFVINLPEMLPERFTMEFELTGNGNGMSVFFDGESDRWDTQNPHIEIGEWFGTIKFGEGQQAQGELPIKTGEAAGSVRIHVDGSYVKLYMNERRVAQVPNANFGRSNRVRMFLNGWSADAPRMVSNIRIMGGGRELYDALAEEGRIATQGILFDTGSDVIRPESTPTLKEIGTMLKDHPDLRIAIEGHTDDTGDADQNQQLSERRAIAVKAFLEATYAIDAARLEAHGFGPTKPVADNGTPEGRQQNRRVELVKL